jgi:hypothetical protein
MGGSGIAPCFVAFSVPALRLPAFCWLASLSSLSATHIGVLRGFVSAYSQNDVAGTTQLA